MVFDKSSGIVYFKDIKRHTNNAKYFPFSSTPVTFYAMTNHNETSIALLLRKSLLHLSTV